MKIFRTFVVSISVLWCGANISFGQEFRIMSYNIHHGKDAQGAITLDSMGHFIANSNIDLAGLQEVDSLCTRSHQIDQTAVLSQIAGMDPYFTRHFAFQGGAYGQGLLSRHPIRNLRNFRLPVFPLDQGTEVSVLLADVHPEPHKKLTVGVVHLDYRSAPSRMQQVDWLLDSLLQIENLILVGDFNGYPNAPEMEKLLVHFNRYHSEVEPPTFPATQPDRRIDFILVKKDSDLRIVDEYIPQVPYSDHLPVITTVEWKTE